MGVVLLLAAGALFLVSLTARRQKAVLTVEDVKGMQKTSGDFRSINNWKTVEQTDFIGVRLDELLKSCGIREKGTNVKVIGSDGYFWPKVGTTLESSSLSKSSPDGLRPLIVYSMNGSALDPEPDGSGPLRYVAPQYSTDEVNKPSWVSNLRVIEVKPFPKGLKSPDPKDVPEGELWVVGDLGAGMPPTRIAAFVVGGVAVAWLLVIGVIAVTRKKKSGSGLGAAAAICILALAFAFAGPLGPAERVEAASFTFSTEQLKGMPSFSGHYTFLKQLEPYTYYESDYKGVPLDALFSHAVNLAPGAQGIKVRAKDGYEVSLTMDEALRVYPGNLKCMIAYEQNGKPLKSSEEGPLRLIVPQNHPGKKDQGGDPNTPKCARMICSLEVLPSGAAAPAPSSIPQGSLQIYGAVVPPPAPTPSPAPQPPTPQPAPAPQQGQQQTGEQQPALVAEGITPEGKSTDKLKPEVRAVLGLFGDSIPAYQVYWGGAGLSMLFPKPMGPGLRLAFYSMGTGR